MCQKCSSDQCTCTSKGPAKKLDFDKPIWVKGSHYSVRVVDRSYCPNPGEPRQVLVIETRPQGEIIWSVSHRDGRWYIGSYEIENVPTKNVRWVIICRGGAQDVYAGGCLFESEEQAKKAMLCTTNALAIHQIEWEE